MVHDVRSPDGALHIFRVPHVADHEIDRALDVAEVLA